MNTKMKLQLGRLKQIKYLLNFRMLEWISSHQEDDPFVNPDHPQMKKANPWIEKKSCTIL